MFNAIAAGEASRVGELLSATSVEYVERFSEERRRVRAARPKWLAQAQVTALELAAGSSQSDIVRLLLEFGVNSSPKCVRIAVLRAHKWLIEQLAKLLLIGFSLAGATNQHAG